MCTKYTKMFLQPSDPIKKVAIEVEQDKSSDLQSYFYYSKYNTNLDDVLASIKLLF